VEHPEARWRAAWDIARRSGAQWLEHGAPRLSAALAYYALLSLAPLVVLSVALAGLLYGHDAASGQVAAQLSHLVGAHAAVGIQTVIAGARAPQSGWLGLVASSVTLALGASAVFNELQASLNLIWSVPPNQNRGLVGELRERFSSFVMVLVVALLILVSTIGSSVLSHVGTFVGHAWVGGGLLWQGVEAALSLAVLCCGFAVVFRLVPDAPVSWRAAWCGGLVTSLLFALGKVLLGFYLGRVDVGSAYGAAGSLVVLLVWVYYTAHIFFLGAELTHVLGDTSNVSPSAAAEEQPRG
jgi:membrane protein